MIHDDIHTHCDLVTAFVLKYFTGELFVFCCCMLEDKRL